jgi:hypothetical protein
MAHKRTLSTILACLGLGRRTIRSVGSKPRHHFAVGDAKNVNGKLKKVKKVKIYLKRRTLLAGQPPGT